MRPVKIVECAGRVRGAAVAAFSKRAPSAARASMFGVRADGYP
jgi:hypothetical protein